MDLVREKFVPVSFEIALVNRRSDAEGRFFREKLKVASFNGWMAVTPNGKILNDEPYLDLVIQRGLEKWNALPEAERRPGLKLDDLGPVDPAYDLAPPPGGSILNVSIRSLARDAKGELHRPAKVDLDNPGAPPIDAQAQRDHLWLTQAETAALVPDRPSKGLRYPAPSFLTERIFRFHLKDTATCIPGTSGGQWKTYSGTLTFEVVESTSSMLLIRADGVAQGGGPDFQLQGVLEYAPARKAFTRIDLVAFSEKGHVDKKTKTSAPLGIAFELVSGDRPMDRVPPYFFTQEQWANDPRAMADAYFGTRK